MMRSRHAGHSSSAGNYTNRIRFLSIAFMLFAFLLGGRLFDLQVLNGKFYTALAADQQEIYKKLFPTRGSIYVVEDTGNKQVLYPLVTNRIGYIAYGVPKEIEDATTTALKLLSILGLPDNDEKINILNISTSSEQVIGTSTPVTSKEQELLDKWIDVFNQKEKSYFAIRERLDDKILDQLKAANMKGIGWSEKSYRYYTEGKNSGNIFGFWGYSGDERTGKYGLEGYFDDMLTGKMGEIHTERDAKGNLIALGNNDFTEKIDGADLVLTINRVIQYTACESLKKAVADHGAKGGSIIVMNPMTGEIIAMCSQPDFDPDKYYQVEDINAFNNQAVYGAYEPGSVFKTITIAAALDAGKITPTTSYVDTGMVDYKEYKIRNYNDQIFGRQTMTQVLENSANTGAIYAMKQMTPKLFIEYVKKFGFGEITGIELNKEVAGNLVNLNKKGEVNQATATFGQGISVTPIQFLAAYSALVNGGKLMKPFIVSKVVRGNEVIKYTKPEIVTQVISPNTSALIKGMMVSVVENGHAQKAQIVGYRVGGKTGTAQVPAKGGGYQSDDVVIGSFVGFAPFDNPRVAILVRIDEPVYGKTGEAVAVPTFAEVAKFALQYYNVPHDR